MSDHDEGVLLTGLDGENPLGFLAAIGVLDVCQRAGVEARLGWTFEGRWRPRIQGAGAMDAIVARVFKDARALRDSPTLNFTYSTEKEDRVEDLKPPPAQWRAFLAGIIEASGAASRDEVDRAAAFAPEGGMDNNGATKPTALHFTAGQQRFLSMVTALRDGLREDHVREALIGPWTHESLLPVLGWDVSNDRVYAHRATDPSSGKKTGVPGADWLGLLGLSAFPTLARRGNTLTTATVGSWKAGSLRWCLWEPTLTMPVVKTVTGLDLERLNGSERASMGIVAAFEARIRRTDQGGYGSIAPPQALL